MRKNVWIALTISAALAAGFAWAHDEGSGGSMNGCADMMAGGGMMGGSQPNERWRSSQSR